MVGDADDMLSCPAMLIEAMALVRGPDVVTVPASAANLLASQLPLFLESDNEMIGGLQRLFFVLTNGAGDRFYVYALRFDLTAMDGRDLSVPTCAGSGSRQEA